MFQYTPYALLMLGASLVSLFTAGLVWRRRPGTGIPALMFMLVATAFWSLTYAGELLTSSLSLKLIFTYLAYLSTVTIPTAWLVFILQYTGREQWLTRSNIRLLAIVPVITYLIIISNALHGFFYTEIGLATESGIVVLALEYGLAFWIHAGYSYLLLLTGAILLFQTMLQSSQLYRGQIVWMALGTVTPWVANAGYILDLGPLPPYIDPTPLAFTVSGAAYAWSMYRYRLMDIVPVAKDTIINNLISAIVVLDLNNRIVEVNAKALEIIGKPASEVVGQPAATVFSHHPGLVEKFRDIENSRKDISIEVGGDTHIFDFHIIPLNNRQGSLTGRVLMLHEITELKQMNQELVVARQQAEEANRLKSQFLATMSHELRTPLNAIIGFAEILKSGMGGIELGDRASHMINRIHTNSLELLLLINDVLDLAKIEAQRIDLVNKPYSPVDLIHELYSEMESLVLQKQLTFDLDLADNLPEEIIGDPAQVKRVITNLISNAIKFTHEGNVTLEAGLANGGADWEIVVTDTGIGIPPHALDYIFDPFRQVDDSAQRAYGGTGLGLAIAQELVNAMGGGICVKSTLGEGATFMVTLPAEMVVPEQAREVPVV